MFRGLFFIVTFAFAISNCKLAWSGVEEGKAALGKGNIKAALEEFRRAAVLGDAKAQLLLGDMFSKGLGVPQDYKEASKWYKKAASQDLVQPQYNLGVMYYFGMGVIQDYKEAAIWYTKAAEQGDTLAQNNLGVMYQQGQGVMRDDREAPRFLSSRRGSTRRYSPICRVSINQRASFREEAGHMGRAGSQEPLLHCTRCFWVFNDSETLHPSLRRYRRVLGL